MRKAPSLVIDFDGVICEHRFPDVGEPTGDVRDALRTLKNAGYRIVIHSCRTSLQFRDLLIPKLSDLRSTEKLNTHLKG